MSNVGIKCNGYIMWNVNHWKSSLHLVVYLKQQIKKYFSRFAYLHAQNGNDAHLYRQLLLWTGCTFHVITIDEEKEQKQNWTKKKQGTHLSFVAALSMLSTNFFNADSISPKSMCLQIQRVAMSVSHISSCALTFYLQEKYAEYYFHFLWHTRTHTPSTPITVCIPIKTCSENDGIPAINNRWANWKEQNEIKTQPN